MAENKGFRICNFCGKPENKVGSMFSAGTSNICDECVCYCYELLYGEQGSRRARAAAAPSAESRSSARSIS